MDGLTTLDRRHSPNPQKLLEVQSEFVQKTFVPLPKPPTNLNLDGSQATSLKIKWNHPKDFDAPPKYSITVHSIQKFRLKGHGQRK